MPKTESQKAASAKWDKENMAVLSCRVTKKKADLFRLECSRRGSNVNAILLEYVDRIIKEGVQE